MSRALTAAQRHMGNAVLDSAAIHDDLDRRVGRQPWSTCRSRATSTPYLAPHSDIVALMVLEHQVAMHNRLTAANYSAADHGA